MKTMLVFLTFFACTAWSATEMVIVRVGPQGQVEVATSETVIAQTQRPPDLKFFKIVRPDPKAHELDGDQGRESWFFPGGQIVVPAGFNPFFNHQPIWFNNFNFWPVQTFGWGGWNFHYFRRWWW